MAEEVWCGHGQRGNPRDGEGQSEVSSNRIPHKNVLASWCDRGGSGHGMRHILHGTLIAGKSRSRLREPYCETYFGTSPRNMMGIRKRS